MSWMICKRDASDEKRKKETDDTHDGSEGMARWIEGFISLVGGFVVRSFLGLW